MENKNQKRMVWLIGAFLFIFVVSIVYAIGTDTLQIRGTATFSEVLRVDFATAVFSDSARGGENINISSDGQDLAIQVVLNSPSDSRTINSTLENTGNIDAVIDGFSANPMTGLIVSLSSALEGAGTTDIPVGMGKFLPGNATSASGVYTLTVQWDPNYPELSGTFDIGDDEAESVPSFTSATVFVQMHYSEDES